MIGVVTTLFSSNDYERMAWWALSAMKEFPSGSKTIAYGWPFVVKAIC